MSPHEKQLLAEFTDGTLRQRGNDAILADGHGRLVDEGGRLLDIGGSSMGLTRRVLDGLSSQDGAAFLRGS